MIKKIIIFIISFSLFSLIINSQEPVYYVLDLSGEFIHEYQGKKEPITFKTPIYNKSILIRKSKEGFINVIDNNVNEIQLTEFPVAISNKISIDKKKQKIILGYIGGTIINGSKGSDELFEWYTDVGSILENDIKNNNLYLVFSKNNSSNDKNSYMPLIYKLKDDLSIKKISYKITNKTLILKEGKMDKKGDDFIFRFDTFNYRPDVSYLVTFNITTSGNKQKTFTLSYKIFNDEEYINEEINDKLQIISDKNTANEGMIKAAKIYVYDEYNMNIYKLILLRGNKK